MQGFKYFIALSENIISQELKKLNPDEVKKNQSEAESIYKSLFNFDIDSKKQKEIINWITYFLPLNQDVKNKMNKNRDFLYTNYDRINFKTNEYTPAKLDADSQQYHENLKKTTKIGSKGAYGKPIITFPNGWKWVSLEKGYCPIEAQTMGHCGNVAGKYNNKHNIISLRNPQNVPYLTFIDEGNGVLGEMKGRFNNKPEEKFHPYIAELLLSPKINKIKGGGYAPENNFELTDLNDQLYNKVIQQKPNLLYSPLEIVKSIKEYDPNDPAATNNSEADNMFITSLIQQNILNSNGKLTSTAPQEVEDHFKKIMQNNPIIVAAGLLRHKFKLHKQLKDYIVEKYKTKPFDRINDLVLIYKKDIELFDKLFNNLSNKQKSLFVLRAILFRQKLSDKLYEYLNEDDAIQLENAMQEQNLKVPPTVLKIIERYKKLADFEHTSDVGKKDAVLKSKAYIFNKLYDDPYEDSWHPTIWNAKNKQRLIVKERLIKNLKAFFNYAFKYLPDSDEEILRSINKKYKLYFNDDYYKKDLLASYIADELSGYNYGNDISTDFASYLPYVLPRYLVYPHKTPDVTEYLIKLGNLAAATLQNAEKTGDLPWRLQSGRDQDVVQKINSLVDELKYAYTDEQEKSDN